MDLSILALLKQLTHLPVISDPSHGTGKTDLIEPMSLASIMAGADGLMIEVHISPKDALSDGEQSLTPEQYKQLVEKAVKTKRFYDSIH